MFVIGRRFKYPFKPTVPRVSASINREEAQKVIEARKAAATLEVAGKPFGPDNPDNVAKIDPRPPWERSLRKVRMWEKDIPMNDGKLMTAFRTSEKCGVVDPKTSKPCQQLLIATRVVNYHPLWDENGVGMTLEFDFNDVRYYVFCPRAGHGPSPAGPASWPSEDKK